MTHADAAWDKMLQAIAEGNPVAIAVSPEVYHDQIESTMAANSAYVSTDVECPRLPWIAIYGIPVVVDPNLEPDTFALVNTRDWIDEMRLALDIESEGMYNEAIKYKVTGVLVND